MERVRMCVQFRERGREEWMLRCKRKKNKTDV